MRKRSTRHHLRTHPHYRYAAGLSQRTRRLYRQRVWRTRGLAALVISGILLLVAAVLSTALPSREAHRTVSQVEQQTRVVIVKDDTLPPVMQRIAQCESRDRHFTRLGKVLRGHRNPQDMGRFQINTVVWGKQAEVLGYDLRTPEGNTQMARYIFENYGSTPWRASAKCWSRVS
jgi:hypothetical protein